VYDVPLSSSTTAESEGGPGTEVETDMVCPFAIKESRRTFQRVGSSEGHVGMEGVSAIPAYSGTYSPASSLSVVPL